MKHLDILQRMSLEEKCHLLSGRDFWHTRSIHRLGVESMTLSDGPHGVRRQEGADNRPGLNDSLPATCFPTASAVANSWDPDLGEELGRLLGEEAAGQGVCVLLGPGLNIKRNPLCGRNFEYFSEDPLLAGRMAAGYVRGIQANGVSACLKHFAANNTELRRMASDSIVDERTLREIYLTGFEIAVKEGRPKSVMAAYNQINGVYANENRHLLQEILRDDWGFDGFVVSDWGACNDFVEGVRAGSNLEMPSTGGDSPRQLMQAVKEGRITLTEIDARVDELLDVILSTRAAVDGQAGRAFDADAHHAFARKCAEQSVVLLKNEGDILPLQKGSRVAVIGEFARKARCQGAGSSAVNCTRLDNTLDVVGDFDLEVVGFEPGYPRFGATDPALCERAAELARQADCALMYLGLNEASDSEGLDRSTLAIPQCQIDALKAVSDANPNVVVVLSAGSAVEMPWIDRCRALLLTGLCGQAGAGAALRVILGEANPSGRLSETYPIRYEDCPSAPYFPAKERSVEYREGLYVGYRYYNTAGVPVLFPFGFGLSYTTYEYSNIRLDGKRVYFTLTNAGRMDGAEVAQLYVHAENPRVYRPNRELKGFLKVFLKAGQSRTVYIELDDKAFRYWNSATNRFEIDSGRYEIQVGASVEDIRLTAHCQIKGGDAPACEDPEKLPHYFSGDIRAVPDEEFAALLGHAIPDDGRAAALRMNDAISRLNRARSLKARLVWRILTNRLDRSIERGAPDLNLAFVCNMPIRAVGKLSGGGISQRMCEGLLDIANGHAGGFFKGLGKLIPGFVRQRRAAKRAKTLE